MNKVQFFLFVLCGGIAAFANIGARVFFSLWINYSAAIILAFFVGMATAFILFRAFVFSGNKEQFQFNVISQIGWYLFINALGLLQTWGISVLLNNYIFLFMDFHFYKETTAHIIGVMVPIITSYLGHKFLTFR